MRSLTTILTVLPIMLIAAAAHGQITADFEDLTLAPESYYNGSDFGGNWQSQTVDFSNSYTVYDGGWTSWDGFAYSNQTDNTTPGFGNQYAAATGSAFSGDNYAIASIGWSPAVITLPEPRYIEGAYFTNTTYANFAIQGDDGNEFPFVREFGDDPANGLGDGNEGFTDYFKLTIIALDANGNATGNTVDFMLADFTAADNGDDYIVDTWQYVDLTGLGVVSAITFTLESTDTGDFGMNTPGYFAMDDLMVSATPEPAGLTVLLAISGCVFTRRGR